MSDITFKLGNTTIILRAGAIILRDREVLLCQSLGEDWWFTPGGRIRTSESSYSAIKRELSEEIGEHFDVNLPVICSENFFTLDGRQFHEMCVYYSVVWTGSKQSCRSDAGEIRQWFPVKRLPTVNLKPSFLKQYIGKDFSGVEHVIHRDGVERERS